MSTQRSRQTIRATVRTALKLIETDGDANAILGGRGLNRNMKVLMQRSVLSTMLNRRKKPRRIHILLRIANTRERRETRF